MKQLRIAGGATHGEAGLPATCAELSFPSLDAFADKPSDKTEKDLKGKAKDTSKFVQNYFDQRAQASYVDFFLPRQTQSDMRQAYANPNLTLTSNAGAAPEFKSRFADPNNATNTHFFTLITGGKFKAEPQACPGPQSGSSANECP